MEESRTTHTVLTWLKYLIVLAMFVAGALVYTRLPQMLPSHWNIYGQADAYQSKEFGTWLLPGIALLMVLLFPVLSRLDPKRENYPQFIHAWDVLQVAITGLMGWIYGTQLYASLNPEQSALVGQLIVFGVGALFVIIGNYMGKIRQNYFIGVKTPWALSDPEVWQRSQRFGGWAFVLGGLAMIVESIVWIGVPWFFFATVSLIVLLPIIYSYLIFKKLKTLWILIAICALVLATITVGMRLTASEDSWICTGGQWTKHGNPSAPMPTVPCE